MKIKGFTFIELIVVMIIIGILLFLAIPRFLNYSNRAKFIDIQNDIKVLENALLAKIASENLSFYDTTEKIAIPKDKLFEAVKKREAYMVDGYLVEDSQKDSFKPKEGTISNWKISDQGKGLEGFYLLDHTKFMATNLKNTGSFLSNSEGRIIYIKNLDIGDPNTNYSIKYVLESGEIIYSTSIAGYIGTEVEIKIEEFSGYKFDGKIGGNGYLDGNKIRLLLKDNSNEILIYLNKSDKAGITSYKIMYLLENGDSIRDEKKVNLEDGSRLNVAIDILKNIGQYNVKQVIFNNQILYDKSKDISEIESIPELVIVKLELDKENIIIFYYE